MIFAGFFGAAAIILFILGLYEERDTDDSDNSQHLIIILMFFSALFSFFAGIALMMITESYVANEEYITIYVKEYIPFSWACIVLGFVPLLMCTIKVFDYLGVSFTGEN